MNDRIGLLQRGEVGNGVGPQAECDGRVRRSRRSERRTRCPPVPRNAASCVRTNPARPVSTRRSRRPCPMARDGARSVGDAAMAEREQPVHHAARDEPTGDCPQRPERQGVVDVVDQLGAAVGNRRHAVGVHPALERAGHLDVLELHAIDETAMHRFPSDFNSPRRISIVRRLPSAMPPWRDRTRRCSQGGASRSKAPGRTCQANRVAGGSVEDRVFLVGRHGVRSDAGWVGSRSVQARIGGCILSQASSARCSWSSCNGPSRRSDVPAARGDHTVPASRKCHSYELDPVRRAHTCCSTRS